MTSFLLNLIDKQRQRIASLPQISQHDFTAGKSLQQCLTAPGLSVIAEVKRASPSKGELAQILQPLTVVEKYIAGGAAALSVLTEPTYFKGSLQDLHEVATHCVLQPQAVLRKDFIIDPRQIVAAKQAGADAVLLMVAALPTELATLMQCCQHVGVEALVEVHTDAELAIALDANASIIAVNNRNLHTLEIDPRVALRLIDRIPDSITSVAASAIETPQQAQDYHAAGYDAVLIGEALVKSKNPTQFIQQCRGAL